MSPVALARARRLANHPAFQGLNARFVGPAQVAAKQPGLQAAQHVAAEGHIAGNRPGVQHRLPVPGAAEAVQAQHSIVGRVGQKGRRRIRQRRKLHPQARPLIRVGKQLYQQPSGAVELLLCSPAGRFALGRAL